VNNLTERREEKRKMALKVQPGFDVAFTQLLRTQPSRVFSLSKGSTPRRVAAGKRRVPVQI